jgi:hypothetical protein
MERRIVARPKVVERGHERICLKCAAESVNFGRDDAIKEFLNGRLKSKRKGSLKVGYGTFC